MVSMIISLQIIIALAKESKLRISQYKNWNIIFNIDNVHLMELTKKPNTGAKI